MRSSTPPAKIKPPPLPRSAPRDTVKSTVKVMPLTEATAKTAPEAAPARAIKALSAKTIPVRADSPPPAPVRAVAEASGAGGRAWRMNSRHAVAYVHDAVLAGELLATEPRHVARAAMAVYYDRKGRPFAWQVRFDAARWHEVIGRLG